MPRQAVTDCGDTELILGSAEVIAPETIVLRPLELIDVQVRDKRALDADSPNKFLSLDTVARERAAITGQCVVRVGTTRGKLCRALFLHLWFPFCQDVVSPCIASVSDRRRNLA